MSCSHQVLSSQLLFGHGGGSLAARSDVLLEGLRNVVSQKRTKIYHGLRRQIHKEGRSLSLQRYKDACVDFLFAEESDAYDQQIYHAWQ